MNHPIATKPAPGRSAPWLSDPERGTIVAIRALVWVADVFGRRWTRGVLSIVAFYYALFARGPAAASRRWWRRVDGREPRFRDVYRHIQRFCHCAFDRLYFLRGSVQRFEIERQGAHHLEALEASGTGAILLGAHLGSFDAMRAMSKVEGRAVHVLTYFDNAKKINAVLAAVAPGGMHGVIPIRPNDPSFVFEVKDRIDRGEMIAMLGDRVGLSDRTVRVPFMGHLAAFPAGPFVLAATLGCPIYLVFGLYQSPDRYRLFCEPLAERIDLPRRDRDRLLQKWVSRYATRLEHYAQMAPDNWFNFFDFWRDPS